MKTQRFAYAKINFTLEILDRRPDGYHDILSVMQKVALHDVLTFEFTEEKTIFVTCDKDVCAMTDNLVYKAAVEYRNRFEKRTGKSFGLSVAVEKHIPDKAGLAGGSADCACVLDFLYETVGGLSYDEVEDIAASLGSDINFCLNRYCCALCTDRGIKVEPIAPYQNGFVVIAKPEAGLKTSEVYRAFDASPIRYADTPSLAVKERLNKGDCLSIAPFVKNAFTPICTSLCPEIGNILKKMRACSPLFCEMSGAGAAVYGVFSDRERAQAAYESLRRESTAFLTECVTESKTACVTKTAES